MYHIEREREHATHISIASQVSLLEFDRILSNRIKSHIFRVLPPFAIFALYTLYEAKIYHVEQWNCNAGGQVIHVLGVHLTETHRRTDQREISLAGR